MAKLTKRKLTNMTHDSLVLLILDQQKQRESLILSNNGMADLAAKLRHEIVEVRQEALVQGDKTNFKIRGLERELGDTTENFTAAKTTLRDLNLLLENKIRTSHARDMLLDYAISRSEEPNGDMVMPSVQFMFLKSLQDLTYARTECGAGIRRNF